MSDDKKQLPETKTAKETGVEASSTEKNRQQPQKNKASKGLFSLIIGFISFSALATAVAAGYFGFNQFQQMSTRLQSLEQNEKNVQIQASENTKIIQRDFSSLQKQLQQTLSDYRVNRDQKVVEIAQQITAAEKQIQFYAGRHQSDWLLAEADYLVRIASNRLSLERDHVTALALLMRADERLILVDDPGLLKIREALSRDITALRLLKREDVAAIAIRISGLMPQLSRLKVASFQLPVETMNEEPIPQETDGDWMSNLKKTLTELSVKWFDVRNHGRLVKPIMTEESESIVRTNMSLLLQTAQFATLKQHKDLYEHSIKQLEGWITEYFDVLDPTVIAFITELESLAKMSVRIDLPKTLESRLLLARLVEQRLRPAAAVIASDLDEQK